MARGGGGGGGGGGGAGGDDGGAAKKPPTLLELGLSGNVTEVTCFRRVGFPWVHTAIMKLGDSSLSFGLVKCCAAPFIFSSGDSLSETEAEKMR